MYLSVSNLKVHMSLRLRTGVVDDKGNDWQYGAVEMRLGKFALTERQWNLPRHRDYNVVLHVPLLLGTLDYGHDLSYRVFLGFVRVQSPC